MMKKVMLPVLMALLFMGGSLTAITLLSSSHSIVVKNSKTVPLMVGYSIAPTELIHHQTPTQAPTIAPEATIAPKPTPKPSTAAKAVASPTPTSTTVSAKPSPTPVVVVAPKPTSTPPPTPSNPCDTGGIQSCGTLPTLTFNLVQNGQIVGNFTLSASSPSWTKTFTNVGANSIGADVQWDNYDLSFSGNADIIENGNPVSFTFHPSFNQYGVDQNLGDTFVMTNQVPAITSETLTYSYKWN